jgi:hypothetical protein
MKEMTYLEEESKEAFKDETKIVNFKDPDMKASENLQTDENLNTGFFRLKFTISKSKNLTKKDY